MEKNHDQSLFVHALERHAVVMERVRGLEPVFASVADRCVRALKGGGKLLWFGNGGSAADAQHLATECVVRLCRNRPAIPALSLATDTSALTAIGNDLGFDHVFARQIEALGRVPDVAIAISTSGRSPNILKGLEQARSAGLATVLFTGEKGRGCPLADDVLVVPDTVNTFIQEAHIWLGHTLCVAIEQALYGDLLTQQEGSACG
jgi:D-sedoheptulose 7-phosphate isomerase